MACALKTLEWKGGLDGPLLILDQRRLPAETLYLEPANLEDVIEAIRTLAVRGAPAIGIAAAYGMVLAARESRGSSPEERLAELETDARRLIAARPTAVNLAWAVERTLRAAHDAGENMELRLLEEARLIHDEDRRMCAAMGEYGAPLMPKKGAVLTHCNAGALATGGEGTALAPIYEASRRGAEIRVFACETRPLLQGARLTAFELKEAGVPVTLITDNMAAAVMSRGMVDAVITGADRITARGDAANKIGTLSHALAARRFGLPFYVAAPASTFDLSIDSGDLIPIEQRDPGEITSFQGVRTAPEGVDVYNPAFDVTPAELITAIITDRGVIKKPDARSVARILGSDG